MDTQQQIRFKPSEFTTLMIVTLGSFLVAVSFRYPLAIGFLPGLSLLLFLVWKKGVSIKKLLLLSKEGIAKVQVVNWLFILISVLLPTWVLSGTVEYIISLTLQWMNMDFFFCFVFIVTVLLSMLLGTAIGTLSIIGVPIIGVAHLAGIPLEWTAGALVSGALVGDRTSPFSSARQLLFQSLQLTSDRQMGLFSKVTWMGLLCATLFYLGLDLSYDFHIRSTQVPVVAQSGLDAMLYLIPPVVLLLTMVLLRDLRYAFTLSIISATLLAWFHGVSLELWVKTIWAGAKGLGGLEGTILMIVFMCMAGIYCEIMEKCHVLQPFIATFTSNTHSIRVNMVRSVCLALMICLVSPNQAFPIMLTGRGLMEHWKQHFSVNLLVSIIENTSMVIVGLVPWNLLALLCSQILHVPVIDYVPFAAFLWMMPLLVLAGSWRKEDGMGKGISAAA